LPFRLINENEIRADDPDQRLVIFESQGLTKLHIEFGGIDNLNGYWAYHNANVTTEGALQGSFDPEPAYMEKGWGDVISGQQIPKTPHYFVSLPLTDTHRHQWLFVTAEMDVVYPKLVSGGDFANRRRLLTRQLELFVGSSEDTDFRKRYDMWKNEHDKWEIISSFPGGAKLVISGSVVIIVVLWVFGVRILLSEKRRLMR
jgi:hypothetical protein